ncbi:MAG TPA: hypothetical protein VFZ21_07420, partial [Gemmatimonadaceae bacterium]|nr:hypothetical protein [Gemmatimonadaceae bacterium]
MPAECSLLLELYEDDRTTIAWEASTDPAHASPYLIEPHHYGAQQIDVAKGAATIGTVTVGVIDPATIAGDQDSGWMTERLVEVYGRRCRLRRYVSLAVGYVVIADGPAGEPRLDDSYAAYMWEIRDTRETERKARVFEAGGSRTLAPEGVLGGYGYNAADDEWLIEPMTPYVGTFTQPYVDATTNPAGSTDPNTGIVILSGHTSAERTITNAAFDAMAGEIIQRGFADFPGSHSEGYYRTRFRELSVVWRPNDPLEAWHEIPASALVIDYTRVSESGGTGVHYRNIAGDGAVASGPDHMIIG